jgi:hypothetical protein
MTFGVYPAQAAALCVVKKTASHGGTMLRTRGNRDQLVRLANGVRVVDGERHRQHIYFYRRHASLKSLGD